MGSRLWFHSGGFCLRADAPSPVYRGGAVRFSFSLVAFGSLLFFSCLLGLCPFGNKFLIIQKKKNLPSNPPLQGLKVLAKHPLSCHPQRVCLVA